MAIFRKNLSHLAMVVSLLSCVGLLHGAESDAEIVTAWATEPLSLDLSEAMCRLAVGEVSIWHNPDWCTGGTNVEGAVVALKAVTNPDTDNAVTTTVALAEIDKLSFTDWQGNGYVRLILSAELDGKTIGDTLVSDISFGTESAFSTGIAFDARINALQEVVDAKARTTLRYDLNWADVATKADIFLVCTKKAKNGSVISVSTNEVGSMQSPIMGSIDLTTANLQWGDYVLLLREYAADGSKILESESPGFSIAHVFGTCVIIR